MDKVLPKIVKRGSDQGKVYAQAVLDNAAAVSKQKSLDSKASKPSGTQMSAETSSESKRPSSGGVAGSQAQRKPPSANATASSNNDLAGAKGGNLTAKKPAGTESKALNKGAVHTTTAPKVKTNVVAPKATSFFSSLQSASKKPGTSNAALKAARLKDTKDGYVNRGLATKTMMYNLTFL